MNSYTYFSKYELSFILNHERRYAPQIISDLKESCRIHGIDIEKVKYKREVWDLLNQDRISRSEQSDRLIVHKKRAAKVLDYRTHVFMMFVMIVLLCLSSYRLFSFQSLELLEKIGLVVGIPILLLLLFSVYQTIKELKKMIDIQISLEFFQTGELNVLKNTILEYSTEIKEVKLIWLKDRNDDNPEISLRLIFANDDMHEVDKSANFYELFDTFSDIVRFTNVKFTVEKSTDIR